MHGRKALALLFALAAGAALADTPNGVTLLDQSVQLLLLLSNPLGCSFFILRARRGGGLFDQLPDVVPQYGDAVVEFG